MSKFITEEDKLLAALRDGYNREAPVKTTRLDQTPVHILMPRYRGHDGTEEAAHLGRRLKRTVHDNAPMCSTCNEVEMQVQMDVVTDSIRFAARCKHRDCIHVAEPRFEVRIEPPRFNPADYLCDFRVEGSASPASGSKSKTLIQPTKQRSAPMELSDKPKTESPDSW